MMTELNHFSVLAFGMVGWQELVILFLMAACPLATLGIVFLILYLTGVIGKKNK